MLLLFCLFNHLEFCHQLSENVLFKPRVFFVAVFFNVAVVVALNVFFQIINVCVRISFEEFGSNL